MGPRLRSALVLARVADALYWTGRYLERAEQVTRVLLVTEDLATEIQGLDEPLAQAQWSDLQAVFPGARLTERSLPPGASLAIPYLASFFVEEANPYSALYSVRKARENARAVREALTAEVFLSLNEVYRDLEALARKMPGDVPAYRDALSATQRGLLATVGAIEYTLTRDEAWLFLKLGEALERVWRTARILTVKLPDLLDADPKTESPLYYARWRSLLRCLASLENYRATHGARMDPVAVVRFVLFDGTAPRALDYGCHTVVRHLDALAPEGAPTAPRRIMGRLCARLDYDEAEIMERGYYLVFLQSFLDEIERAHDAITARYFLA